MEFSRNPTERFKTLPAVYMAIKMSQLKVSLELNVHSAEEIEGKVQGGAVSKLRSTRYPGAGRAGLCPPALTGSEAVFTCASLAFTRAARAVRPESWFPHLLTVCTWAHSLTSLNLGALFICLLFQLCCKIIAVHRCESSGVGVQEVV